MRLSKAAQAGITWAIWSGAAIAASFAAFYWRRVLPWETLRSIYWAGIAIVLFAVGALSCLEFFKDHDTGRLGFLFWFSKERIQWRAILGATLQWVAVASVLWAAAFYIVRGEGWFGG